MENAWRVYRDAKIKRTGLAFFATPHNGDREYLVALGAAASKVAKPLYLPKAIEAGVLGNAARQLSSFGLLWLVIKLAFNQAASPILDQAMYSVDHDTWRDSLSSGAMSIKSSSPGCSSIWTPRLSASAVS